MTTRTELHALIDALPDETLPSVAKYLAAVAAGPPADVPLDDEPLSPGEEAMRAASEAALARGEVVTHEEVLARRAARRSTP